MLLNKCEVFRDTVELGLSVSVRSQLGDVLGTLSPSNKEGAPIDLIAIAMGADLFLAMPTTNDGNIFLSLITEKEEAMCLIY